MTHLFFFRHGIAVPHGTPGVEESQRPLTAKGERRTRQVARGLRPFLRDVDRILTSPLPRALRTAEIVAEVIGGDDLIHQVDVFLPGANPTEIRGYLETRSEARIMVVGHNPNLSELMTLLITGVVGGNIIELRKGGAACLTKEPNRPYQLEWFVRPRIARKLC